MQQITFNAYVKQIRRRGGNRPIAHWRLANTTINIDPVADIQNEQRSVMLISQTGNDIIRSVVFGFLLVKEVRKLLIPKMPFITPNCVV
jgi:hypothetical protein